VIYQENHAIQCSEKGFYQARNRCRGRIACCGKETLLPPAVAMRCVKLLAGSRKVCLNQHQAEL
jgi:hypothetical protein